MSVLSVANPGLPVPLQSLLRLESASPVVMTSQLDPSLTLHSFAKSGFSASACGMSCPDASTLALDVVQLDSALFPRSSTCLDSGLFIFDFATSGLSAPPRAMA